LRLSLNPERSSEGQSPKTGRGIQAPEFEADNRFANHIFQSPKTGRGYSDWTYTALASLATGEFQSPKTGRGYSDPISLPTYWIMIVDFNPLRRGGGIQTANFSAMFNLSMLILAQFSSTLQMACEPEWRQTQNPPYQL
jgi:hypothetical protein